MSFFQSRKRKKYCNAMRLKMLLMLILFQIFSFACRKKGDYGIFSEAKEENLNSSVQIFKSAKPVRIGVMDFTDKAGNNTLYGSVIADEVLEKIAGYSFLHVMERSRIKLLLEEQNLNETGLIRRDDVLRLGGILPVDVIVLGSYFHQAKGVKVNGRFIDVSSGEIKGTFSYLIPQPRMQPFRQVKNKKEDCSKYEKEIYTALEDLRTEVKINSAVEKAVRIPYSAECAYIHYRAMSVFRMGKVYPELYLNFLRDSIVAIQDPGEVDRKRSALYYFRSDKHIDEKEWAAGLLVLKYVTARQCNLFVSMLLNAREEEPASVYRRMDELFMLAEKGILGRPHRLSSGDMFVSVNHALGGFTDDRSFQFRLYLYENYLHTVKNNPRDQASAISQMIDKVYDARGRTQFSDPILKYAVDFAVKIDPDSSNKYLEDRVWSILSAADSLGQGQKNSEKYKYVFKELSPWICSTLKASRNNYEGKKRASFAVKHGVTCGSLVDAKKLIDVLKSNTETLQRKEEASGILAGMSSPVSEARAVSFEYLGPRGSDPDYNKIRQNCISILMKINKNDPLLINHLIDFLSDRRLGSFASVSLKEIDLDTTMPHFRKALRNQKDSNSITKILFFLKSYGKQAGAAIPEIKHVKNSNSNEYVRRVASDALLSIDVPF